ncbi:MAG: hypothetical protein R2873_35680 [Caldilineaceae bacterium]
MKTRVIQTIHSCSQSLLSGCAMPAASTQPLPTTDVPSALPVTETTAAKLDNIGGALEAASPWPPQS